MKVLEACYSAGALAAMTGLAVLYRNGQNLSSSRQARSVDAEFFDENTDMAEMVFDSFESDLEFMTALGYMDADANVPEGMMDDVAMLQDENSAELRASGRKQIQYVIKCLKNADCRERAQKTVRGWGINNRKYMEGNVNVLLKPVSTRVNVNDAIEENGNLPVCTPNDDVFRCTGNADDPEAEIENFIDYTNRSPSQQLSGHPVLQEHIAELIADDENATNDISTKLTYVTNNLNVANPASSDNVIGKDGGQIKFNLIVPNGIPVHMASHKVDGEDKLDYNVNYGNYWNFFKTFNSRYMGINADNNNFMVDNRNNIHFWFIRQDKAPKAIMSAPVKANKRFPWNRFDKLMKNPQPTAAQPKLVPTYELLQNRINNKNLGSMASEGRDCVTFWFHQYIPQDLLELADSNTQDIIDDVEKQCVVIHFWVGQNKMMDDNADSAQVVKYLQGILQPGQNSKTSIDPEMRSWYDVDDITNLADDQNVKLMSKVYNNIALERYRCKCLMAESGKEMASELEKINEELAAKESDYVFYEYGSTTDLAWDATSEVPYDDWLDLTSAPSLDYSEDDSDLVDSDVSLRADYACCGIGLGAKRYNINEEECCEDGNVGTIGEFECY